MKQQVSPYRYNMELIHVAPAGSGAQNTLSKRKHRRIIALLLESQPIKSLGVGVAADYGATLITIQKINMGHNDFLEVPILYREVEEAASRQNATKYKTKISLTGRIVYEDLEKYLQSTASDKVASYDKADNDVEMPNIIMARAPN